MKRAWGVWLYKLCRLYKTDFAHFFDDPHVNEPRDETEVELLYRFREMGTLRQAHLLSIASLFTSDEDE